MAVFVYWRVWVVGIFGVNCILSSGYIIIIFTTQIVKLGGIPHLSHTHMIVDVY